LGRKSLAQEYFDEVPEEEDRSDGDWLVMYDFDSKLNHRFWLNLRRLVRLLGEGTLVQYSARWRGITGPEWMSSREKK
jgi:hypothetical protein